MPTTTNGTSGMEEISRMEEISGMAKEKVETGGVMTRTIGMGTPVAKEEIPTPMHGMVEGGKAIRLTATTKERGREMDKEKGKAREKVKEKPPEEPGTNQPASNRIRIRMEREQTRPMLQGSSPMGPKTTNRGAMTRQQEGESVTAVLITPPRNGTPSPAKLKKHVSFDTAHFSQGRRNLKPHEWYFWGNGRQPHNFALHVAPPLVTDEGGESNGKDSTTPQWSESESSDIDTTPQKKSLLGKKTRRIHGKRSGTSTGNEWESTSEWCSKKPSSTGKKRGGKKTGWNTDRYL